MNTHVIEEKVYCFTENEFSILLSAAGVTKLICFDLEGGKRQFEKPGQRECNEAILSLIQAGVLEVEEDHYLVKEEVKNIFRAIKNCRAVLSYSTTEGGGASQCIYIGSEECYCVASSGGNRSDYIRISYYEEKPLKEFLEETGILVYGKPDWDAQYDANPEGTDRIEIIEGQSGNSVFEAEIGKRNGIPRQIETAGGKIPYRAETVWEQIKAQLEEKKDDIG